MQAHKRNLGLWSLTCLGIGSMIGSGWLFSAYKTAQYAGGNAPVVWIIGAFFVILLALIVSEIATLHPKTGLFGRVLAISHNKDMGYITAMANWFATLACVPTEALATVQYLSKAKENWNAYLFVNEDLTGIGLVIVTVLLILYSLFNFWGARQLAKSNNVITFFKILVPCLTAIVILYTVFHPVNFTVDSGKLFSHGAASIATALLGGGIAYAFNGFQVVANFCSEVKDPGKNIPLALITSILITLAVYVLLQIAFIGGVPTEMLSQGWSQVSFQSPVVELTTLLGLHIISLLLYADAVVSPSGTGIVYMGATSRMLTGMAQEKHAPAFFDYLHPVFNFSRRSLTFNLFLSLLLLWFFHDWEAIMIVVTLFNAVAYVASPVALARLRIVEADSSRPFRLAFAKIICPLVFLAITMLFCVAPEKNLILVSVVLIIFYATYLFVSNQGQLSGILNAFYRSYNFLLYFIILTGIGLLHNPHGGGFHLISNTMFYSLVTITSIIFYYWLVYGGVKDQLRNITSETGEGESQHF